MASSNFRAEPDLSPYQSRDWKGRQNCHPPASVDVVENGKRIYSPGVKTWLLDSHGTSYVYIRYFAVRNEQGSVETLEANLGYTVPQKSLVRKDF